MLCSSSSYVASTLRTTVINSSFQQHRRTFTGRSRPSCGAHGARADSIEVQLDKKKTRKRASFQVKGISSESPSKTVQDDGMGLRFHALFLSFSASNFSDDECCSRCPPTSSAAPTTWKSAVSGQNWPPKSPQACRASKTM